MEDFSYYSPRSSNILAAFLCHIPFFIVSWTLSFLFRQKFEFGHLSTWRLVSQQIKRLEHSLVENTIEQSTSDQVLRGGKKYLRNEAIHNKNETVLGKLKSVNLNRTHQLPITIADESADQVKLFKNRQFIVWCIVLVMLFGLLTAIVTKGLRTPYIKSCIWITMCSISIATVIILSNTFRVVLQVLFITVVKKKQQDEPLFACDPKLGMRMNLVGVKAYLDKLLVLRSQPEYHPLNPERIREKRKKHRRKHLWQCLFDWMTIFVVYILVFLGTMTSWGTDYQITHHMKYLVKYARETVYDHNLASIKGHDGLMKYLTHLGDLFSTLEWYNGNSLTFEGDTATESGWALDYTNRMIGVIRLRIKRTKIENCVPVLVQKLTPSLQCVRPLNDKNEDKRDYYMGWVPKLDSRSKRGHTPWTYQKSPKEQTLTKYGASGRFYSYGGYILKLERTSKAILKTMSMMEATNWISDQTHVIFMDVCLYSPNTNKISVVSVCVEKSLGVGVRMRIINLPAFTELPTWDILFIALLGLVLIFLVIDLYISISDAGAAFFRSIWNILDVCIVPLFALNYMFSIKYKIILKFNLDRDIRGGQDMYYSFGWIEYYTLLYYLLFTLLFICCSIKPLKYCMNSLQVLPIIMTIRSAWHLIFKIMLFVVPFLYVEFSVIDSLLFNAHSTSNRFPLVNKVGLKQYANMYIFPEDKFVPYLYCQLCSLVIGMFSALIAHHYRISKNSSLLVSNTTDLPFELKQWLQRQQRMRQLRTLKDNVGTVVRNRLRSGADCVDKDHHTESGAALQNTLPTQEEEEERGLELINDKVNLNGRVGKRSQRDMAKVLRNIDTKLDKIVKKLQIINDEL